MLQIKKNTFYEPDGHPNQRQDIKPASGGPGGPGRPGGPGGPGNYEDDSTMIGIKDIPYGTAGHPLQKLNIYLPEQEHFDTFVFFHGGGFNGGDKAEAVPIAKYLTCQGIAVISVNYRVGRDVEWPSYIWDAAEAVAWVKNHIGEYGGSGKIYVGGSSAGGYLSQMLCFDRQYLGAYDIDPTDIAGYIHDSGQPTSHFAVLGAKGIDPARVIVDESAPLYFVGVDKKYSPMMILVSDNDLGDRYTQTLLLVSTLKQFGVPEEDLVFHVMHGSHCQHTFAIDDNGDSVFGQMVEEFIETRR